MKTPVAFFVFNRPDLTRQVFERIAEAEPERLLLIADGPRHGGDDTLCAEVRRIVTSVRWRCTVETNFSDTNMGCGRRIASGLDWVFAHHESAIILEDDCLPSRSFFVLCDELLDRYRDDVRIGAINGFNLGHRYDAPPDYLFSRYFAPWGWATWRRVWRDYDFTVRSFDAATLDSLFDDAVVSAHFKDRIDRARRGEIDTWDYQFVYSILVNSRLCVVPAVNQVRNIGLGRADSSHTSYDHPFAKVTTVELSLPIRHPREVTASAEAHALIEGLARQIQAAPAREQT